MASFGSCLRGRRVGSWLAMMLLATTLAQAQVPGVPDTTEPQVHVPGGGSIGARELASMAANPAAPVTLIQLRDVLLPDISGASGAGNALQLQPTLPIGPFPHFKVIQLVKISLSYVTTPDPDGASGLGDMQLFDLFTNKVSWGRWGYGVAFVFPTASSTSLGQGKWQAGPAIAIIYSGTKHLTAGAVFQNPISFAGSPDRPAVSSLILTPTLTYSFHGGWFAGMSDFNWSYDWYNSSATIPVGVQVGKIIQMGRRPVSLSIEAGGTVVRPSGTPYPGWIVGIEFTPIFRWHID